MEQLDYNLLFRWFVGLGIDEPVWDDSVFTKNRDRLLAGDVAAEFLAGAGPAAVRRCCRASTSRSTAPWSRRGRDEELPAQARPGRLAEQRRRDQGLVVDAELTRASGHAERLAALSDARPAAVRQPVTLAADRGFDARDFVMELRERRVTPHIAQNTSGRGEITFGAMQGGLEARGRPVHGRLHLGGVRGDGRGQRLGIGQAARRRLARDRVRLPPRRRGDPESGSSAFFSSLLSCSQSRLWADSGSPACAEVDGRWRNAWRAAGCRDGG